MGYRIESVRSGPADSTGYVAEKLLLMPLSFQYESPAEHIPRLSISLLAAFGTDVSTPPSNIAECSALSALLAESIVSG
jgi:hypothetical protein